MTIKCLAQPATIFSWVRQPLWDREKCVRHARQHAAEALLSVLNCTHPPPLINVRSASTSSAPSIATSSWVMWTQTQRLITQAEDKAEVKLTDSWSLLSIYSLQQSAPFMVFLSLHRHNFHSATIQADRVWAPTYCGSISFPRLSDSFATSSSYFWVPVQIRQCEAVLQNQLTSL